MLKSSQIGMTIAVILLFFACTDTSKPAPAPAPPGSKTDGPKSLARPAASQTFTGIVRIGDERRTLTDCATGKTYWIEDKTGLLAKKAKEVTEPVHFDGEPSYAILSGNLLGKSSGGHAASFDDVISVEKIDSMSGISAENLCLPFNFICSGTEPFWTMTISEGLQMIVLEDIGEEKARVFPWTEPEKQANGSFLCLSENAAGDRIRIMIKPEKASDGMSETVYDYSAIVFIGKKKWKGVAVRGR